MKTYTAANGIPFNVMITEIDGEHHIDFYDGRYMHTEYGQHIQSYHYSTLLEYHEPNTGIDLYGGVPDWTIDGITYQKILDDLKILIGGSPGADSNQTMRFKTNTTANDPASWLNILYELKDLNNLSDLEQDEINTALAWIAESLNIDLKTL